MIKVNGIHHVAILCPGIEAFEKAVNFYHNSLGMAIAREWGEGAGKGIMIDTGAGVLEIFANGDGKNGGVLAHFALDVEDTDACIEAARAAGLTVTVEPQDICIPSETPYRARMAFCIGFGGEVIEFFQVK